MNNWISVKEKLPENENTVVVKCENGIVTACFHYRYNNKGTWSGRCCCINEIESPYNVTHWMQLPEAPSEWVD